MDRLRITFASTFNNAAPKAQQATQRNWKFKMSTGKLPKLIHLSQQRSILSARLVPDHNDKGYGLIEDTEGLEV